MTKWLSLERPPAQMRKGFDVTLCSVLQTDRKTLFHDFVNVSPEAAPLIILSKDQLFKSERGDRMHSRPVETILANIISEMELGEIERMIDFGLQVILAKNDARRARIEQIANLATVTITPMTTAEFHRRHPASGKSPQN